MSAPEWLPYEEVLRTLGVDEQELARRVEAGRIRSRTSGDRLLNREDVESLKAELSEEIYLEEEGPAGLEPGLGAVAGLPVQPRGSSWRRFWTRLRGFWPGGGAGRDLVRGRMQAGTRLREGNEDRGRSLEAAALPLARIAGLEPLAGVYGRMLRGAGCMRPAAGTLYLLGKLLLAALVAGTWQALKAGGVDGLPPLLSPAALLGCGVVAWALPDLWLLQRLRLHRRRIESDLPFWLDLHATLMEGGMGFDEGLARICEETRHLGRPIFRELGEVYRRISLGVSRTTALRQMADHLKTDGLEAVIGAVVQGEQVGAGIADTLRTQADMMRNKVWEEAQGRAQQLPVKMIFPMAIGVLPSVFLLTVGPTVLKMLSMFSSLPSRMPRP